MITFKFIQNNTATGNTVYSVKEQATGLFCTEIYLRGVLYDKVYWNTFNEMTVNHHEIADAVTSFERKLNGFKKIYHEGSAADRLLL